MKRIEELIASAFDKIIKIDVLKSVLADLESAAEKMLRKHQNFIRRKK